MSTTMTNKSYALDNMTKMKQTTYVMSEDLPEAMLESAKQKEKVSLYLPHLTFNHSGTHSRGAMDGSLLASLQVTTHKHTVGTSILYDMWFKVVLIGCVVLMFLTMGVRFILWKRHCRRVSYRTVPSIDRHQSECYRPQSEIMSDDDFESTFVGVSIPLLQDVSRI